MHTTTMRMHHLARNIFVPGCHATRIDPTHVQSERGESAFHIHDCLAPWFSFQLIIKLNQPTR